MCGFTRNDCDRGAMSSENKADVEAPEAKKEKKKTKKATWRQK